MTKIVAPNLIDRLADIVGPKGITTDPLEIAPWLADWRGRFQGASPAMVSPANADEVAAVVTLAAAAGVALVPQGGNTSMVGGATPPADGSALILSLRRMNRIRRLSAEDNIAVAEAGVILSNLHDAAAAAGRRFPLSLGSKGSATVGGLASTNAGGTQVLRFGTMRSLVTGLEAVLPDGSRFDGLTALRKDNRGYDLKQLLIGAEGTLGVITAVGLRLYPAVSERALAWVGLDSPSLALDLLRRLEAGNAEAIESFELIPADSLALVLEHIAGTRAPLTGAHRWHALIEAVGEGGPAFLEQALGQAIADELAQDAVIAANGAQADAFWRIRESISEAERAAGPAVQHDISVAVADMPGFMLSAARTLETAFPGTSATAFGHLGDGNVHFHVRAPAGVDRARWMAEVGEPASHMVHDLVVAAGGSISAEHGIGQMKLAEFARLGEPGRLGALRAIKRSLDPAGIMNPGKLVPLASGGGAP